MKSASKALDASAVNFGTVGSEARRSYRFVEHAVWRYGLAVLSVGAALAIKLILLHFDFSYPLSTSFLAAIAITFWYGGTGPGVLAFVLSSLAFGYFVLPYQIDYRIVLPNGSTKAVYLPSGGLSHLLYLFYFALVAFLMSWFSSSRRRSERLLIQARNELEMKVEQRTAKLSQLNDDLVGEIAERTLAEDQLRQAEQRLRDVIVNAPVILFALDRSGVITLSEGKGLDAFGVEPGQLVGQSVFDLYHDSPDLHANARRALAGESVTFTTEAVNQFFEIHLIPLLDRKGEVASVTGVTYNITDRRKAERDLRLVIDTIPAMAWATLPDGPNEYCSKRWIEYTGMKLEEALEYGWLEAFHPEDRAAHFARWRAATQSGTLFKSEARIRGVDGVYRWFLTQGVPLRDESGKIIRWYGTNVDIDERKRAESLLAGEKRLLEMIAKGDSLPTVLDALCRLVEEQLPEVLSSVLLLDGIRLRHGAAPSLPQTYIDAVDGLTIGPSEGSYGTAAYRAEPVIVSEIATDPLWDKYRDAALAHSLRACWSTPIFSSEDKVLGTFVLYYREPHSPGPREKDIIEQITHLAGVAIQRKQAEEALRASEQVARGQVEALTYSLDILATAPAPDKFLGQMLSTIGRLLDAQSVVLWLLDEANDSLVFRAAAQGSNFTAGDPKHPYIKDPLAWKQDKALQETIFTGAPFICEDVETDLRLSDNVREYFRSKGIKKGLNIPTLVGGRVKGFIGIRHDARPPYRPEEIELAQALAHQAMLAIQMTDLAEQSRRAAILAERNRMARDIHDTLAQGFTGVIVQLEAVADAISSGEPAEAENYLNRASGLARQSLNEARRSVHALRPEALQRANFWEALKGIVKNTTAGSPICTETKLRGKLPNLPYEWQENLMHIGQEALTNTLKYAHADNFEMQLVSTDAGLRLEFQDDGDGFKVKDGHDGFGLAGMRERVEQMGGELKVTSTRGKGTKVSVVLPLKGKTMP
jgi:PAS domain S-box-containing protein